MRSSRLRADLQHRFPGRPFRVYPGDCNESIDMVLADLADVRWAPTFAFVDQQAREVHWATLEKLAQFRRNSRRLKTELWILSSPAMITKGVAGTHGEKFADQVDLSYGTTDWRRVQHARKASAISAEQYRDEMVNLLRWRLEHVLGYRVTARIPMRMTNGVAIYDMVFATDHWVGNKIMTSLYRKAAQREPRMIAEARTREFRRRAREREARTGQFDLFGDVEDLSLVSAVRPEEVATYSWDPTACWDPASRAWWAQPA